MSGIDTKGPLVFRLEGLGCSDCAAVLEKEVAKLKGVEKAALNFGAAKLTVQGEVEPGRVVETAEKHGITATREGSPRVRVFYLSGLSCADCAAKLEKRIAALPGVQSAELNFGAARLTVTGNVDGNLIAGVAGSEGVMATGETKSAPLLRPEISRRLFASSAAGILLLAGWLADVFLPLQDVSTMLYLAAIVIGGYVTALRAVSSLARFSFDMNVLMTVAVAGAALIGEWREGAVVVFLYAVSGALESYTIDKARQSIRSLVELAPRTAAIRRGGREMELPVEDIHPGDVLLVKPGDKIAMDGKVLTGSSTVNQATITGEAIPAEKTAGDEVFAGTLNQQGFLEVRVTRRSGDTTLARIINMVEEAQAQRAPSQAFIDNFARYYTPAVIALAAGIALLPPIVLGTPWYDWIYRGLALLVTACPCALVVSTPVAIVSAIGNAARNGVLIKGGVYLEESGSLAAIAFDKTGTLTRGTPEISDIIVTQEKMSERELLKIAASVEKMSEHPLARAVVHKAREEGIELAAVTDFEALFGQGARARYNGLEVSIGSPGLFKEEKIDFSLLEGVVEQLHAGGKTVMLVVAGGRLAGILALSDTIREDGREMLDHLRDLGINQTVMLTGDNPAAAGAIAEKVGVDSFMAGLLPQDKVEAIKVLRRQYGKVAMVGDGVNDAPALAAANVGVAMGGAGTDAALEAADVVLMADDLARLPFAIHLSRATSMVIRQNIAFSLVIKIAAVLLVFPGWLTLWLAILADMGASLLVTMNGIRLMGIKPGK